MVRQDEGHIGVDANSGFVHSLVCTAANHAQGQAEQVKARIRSKVEPCSRH